MPIRFFFIASLQGALLVIASLISGCGIFYHVDDAPIPTINLPTHYEVKECSDKPVLDLSKPWWLLYNNEQLNDFITRGLSSNFSLLAAWQNLKQARALSRSVSAQQYPSLTVNGSRSKTKTRIGGTDGEASSTTTSLNSVGLSGGLSYEVDLWGKINASVESGKLEVMASRSDLENTALLLSGQIATLWLTAQEQKATLKLLKEQIALGRKLLKLTKLRFQVGQASALDLYQQQEQLASTLAEVPLARGAFKKTLNQLAVLTGQPPSTLKSKSFSGILPPLPPFPALASPAELLESRPDLRAVRDRIKAAQHDVGAAIADRLPRIDLSLTYDFRAEKAADLFSNYISQVLSSLVMPVIDGGSRAARVDEREANLKSIEALFNHGVLIALQDVENAIIEERERINYIKLLDDQIEFAKARLRESRRRYLNGLTDYLQVTLALQSVQYLERAQILNRSALLITRNQLYLALGGTWTKELAQPEEAP